MDGHAWELKFTADAASLALLRKSDKLKAQTIGPVRTRRLVATYHDTPDDRLFSAGIAIEVRRNGRAWQQCVQPINGAGAIHASAEAALRTPTPDPGAVHDPDIAHALKDVLKDKLVVPRVATDITRTERRLVTPRGDIVDLALDTADVRAGEASDRAFEVELELKAGTPESLIEIARPLAENFQLELSLISSVERGFQLLKGSPPGKAPWIVLPRDASAVEALSVIISSCLRHIALHAGEARRTERSEAVHQIRVGLRRLRAVLSAYARVFASPPLKALADRARDLAVLLSPARDLDVFVSDTLGPAREVVTFPDVLAKLSDNAQARRGAAWATARRALQHCDYRLFLIDVAAVALCGLPRLAREMPSPVTMPARALAGQVLDWRFAKVAHLGKHLSKLTVEERHELRKQLKKLRYPAEFFASLFEGKGAKKFFASLTDLQDDLGHLNDVATARRLLLDMVQFLCAEEPENQWKIALTAGELIGWHAHKADQGVKRIIKHWSRFEEAPRFWCKG